MRLAAWACYVHAIWISLNPLGDRLVCSFRHRLTTSLEHGLAALADRDGVTDAHIEVKSSDTKEGIIFDRGEADQSQATALSDQSQTTEVSNRIFGPTRSTRTRLETSKGTFMVGSLIGQGKYGRLYSGKAPSGELVALKYERLEGPNALLMEATVMTRAAGVGIPRFWHGALTPSSRVLIMDFLDKNIMDLLRIWGGQMSQSIALHIGKQMLQRIAHIQSVGYVHRDIKPDNFMVGLGEQANIVYAIDFGLSALGPRPGQPPKAARLVGTPRYCSINSMSGVQKSWRDDVEEISYVLIFLAQGGLPWQGLGSKATGTTHAEIKKEHERLILEMKQGVEGSPEKLGQGLHPVFAEMIRYARGLSFDAKPDFPMLDGILQQALVELQGEAVPESFEPST